MKKPFRAHLHYRYWLLILGLFILFLTTEKWSDSQHFTTYLANAATLTSLMLGLSAIFYSYISNESLSSSLGMVSTISKSVREVESNAISTLEESKAANRSLRLTTDDLSDAANSLGSTLINLRDLAVSLNATSSSLSDHVQIIIPSMTRVDEGVDALCRFLIKDSASTRSIAMEHEDSVTLRNDRVDQLANDLLDSASIQLHYFIAALSVYASGRNNGKMDAKEIAAACNMPPTMLISFIAFMQQIGLINCTFVNDTTAHANQEHKSTKWIYVDAIPLVFESSLELLNSKINAIENESDKESLRSQINITISRLQ
jgi:hypothetical protein